MKKIATFIFACLSVWALASCEREEPVVVSGATSDLTRTVVDVEPPLVAFYISDTEAVLPAKGNLQYHASTKEYRFADNQYDIIGEENKNITDSYDGWIDLFGWGTGDCPTKTSSDINDYSTFIDWGNYLDEAGWRTLTSEEWIYLARHHDKGFATVCGVHGLVILPRNWTLPQGCEFTAGGLLSWTTKSDKDWNSNIYDEQSWEKMDQAGALFLPFAGSRRGTNIDNCNNSARYWTSSVLKSSSNVIVYFLGTASNYAYNGQVDRSFGYSVRLFKDIVQ